MQKTRSVFLPQRVGQALLVGLIVGMLLITSGCGGSPQSQQQASQSKDQLDKSLRHASDIGVPNASLQSIQKQEATLSSSSAPFSPFNDQAATDYYNNLAKQYQKLNSQTQDAITSSTNQFQSQAQHSMQNFQDALMAARTQKQGNIAVFSQQFTHDQSLLSSAQYPKDYAVISNDADVYTTGLNLLGSTYQQLTVFNTSVSQMKKAGIDVTAMQTQYQNDMQTLSTAVKPTDFQNLDVLISAQYQQAVVSSTQSLPYVGSAKLNQFQQQVGLIKTYGMDSSIYQKRYTADRAAMNKASTLHDYLVVSQQIDTDMAAMHPDLVQGAAHYLVNQINNEAQAWSKTHMYHDKFDGHNYPIDSGYFTDGIGFWLNRELGWTFTTQDYQGVVDEENNELFNLGLMEQDYNDTTPYNQVHATDLQMLSHYNLQHSQVLMVSFVEQAMRVYQNGKLIKSFKVTTGRFELPSLPGVWTVQNRQSPTVFKASEPPGSPFWYPPTPIHYAILYHWGGFFVHDSWWRADYGVGTQFPHHDSGGDESFAGDGSHGCVNMQEDQAAWVYANTNWNTQIAIY